MRKKDKMANVCRSLRKKNHSPVLKSPTHIGFIDVKKMGRKSHTWAPLSYRHCLLYDISLCSNVPKNSMNGELPTHSFPLKEEQYPKQIRDCDSGVVRLRSDSSASACSMTGPGSIPVPAYHSGSGDPSTER
jgi:hypothetical protein